MKPSQRCCPKIQSVNLTAYLIRAVLALIFMSACAFLFVKYFRKNNLNSKGSHNVEIITSLRLTGRDIFLVVHCGPDVIAFTVGPQGSCLMGRWSVEQWQNANSQSETLG